MAKKKLSIGWIILALVVLGIGVLVGVKGTPLLGVLVAFLTLAFVSGAPLFTIMLGGTVIGAISLPRDFSSEFDGPISHMLHIGLGDEVEILSTIPLFIYAGYLLAESGTADRLVRFANAALGWLPGGLAIVTILTCAVFTVFTGASGVTIIALGGVLMPALVKNGYPERFSMGLIAGTGSVGLLFPPATPLFLYGTIYGLTGLDPENWNTLRFAAAGIVPGMVLVGMLSLVAVFVAIKRKLPRQKFDIKELGRSFLLAVPELVVPFGAVAALLLGVFSPSEVAAVTVVYVAILELGLARLFTKITPAWGKPLELRTLWGTSREAFAMIGAIFVIIFASIAMTNYLVTAKVPQALVHWTTAHVHSKILFLLAINVILLIVGTVMDIFSAIVIVLPLIAPIAKEYGIDPYHLGVIFLLNLEVGYLHPPVGLNLFITSVKFQRPITEVMWATIPFLITMIVALLVITYVPALTVVPADRSGSLNDLVARAHEGFEESKVSMPEVTLTDYKGVPLKGPDGKPIVKKFKDCLAIVVDPKSKDVEKQMTAKAVCEQLFIDATNCRPDAKAAMTPEQQTCLNDKISEWTALQMNGDPSDYEKAIIIDSEVALIDTDGKPVNSPDGKQIVRHEAKCPARDAKKAGQTDRENCRAVFVDASSCKINPAKTNDGANEEDCLKAKIGGWVSDHEDLVKPD
jgi:C4-dicarboxylate transporter DctM subunit